jgi:hypothetical protein
MTETGCCQEEIDVSGVELPIRMRAGDTFEIASTITVSNSQTISSATYNLYDEDGDVALAGSALISGLTVTWGLTDDDATDLLDEEASYTHALRLTLSDGRVQTLYRGPFNVWR